MRIAVLGTGAVGRTLAAALTAVGHDVVVGTRDTGATGARAEWAGSRLPLASFSDAATDAELVINASSGSATLQVLEQVGAATLAGTVLLDVANPLEYTGGFPPVLSVSNTDSLAERIQRAFPEARVVKSLNTVTAAVMVDPGSVGNGDSTMFVSGDDSGAKAVVTRVLGELGWRDVIDLGELSAARGQEMWLPLWLRLVGAVEHPLFSLKIVR
jgi:8-hydroxy-5-deazaflavin:NADPH oxidoreductase